MQKLIRLLIAILILPALLYAAPGKPNIVIIVADDLGWNTVGWHNPNAITPNLDRLCREGVELDQFYVSPMCSPTRAGFMTGRYPIRYGCARAVIPPWRDFGLPTEETTLADALAQAGYRHCGIFGKWHLGHARTKWHPLNRGFTEFLGSYNGAFDFFEKTRDGELDWHRGFDPSREKGYATTLTGQAAAEFILRAAKDEEPFFCYVPFHAPHSPFQVPPRYEQMHQRLTDKTKRIYFGMITCMDEEVGRILQALEETGEADNTLVLFFSDNGGVGKIKGNNKPLNGHKLTAYQGGVRAAACVKYPARYPGGRKLDERMLFTDVLPTVLSLAGISPADAGCKPLDGIDLNPLLEDQTAALPERDLYFYHGQKGEDDEPISIISGDWKLVVNGANITKGRTDGHRIELFRISEDPSETRNVAEQHPETVDRLFGRLVAFRKLQPADAVLPYSEGREGFVAPKEWKMIDQDGE